MLGDKTFVSSWQESYSPMEDGILVAEALRMGAELVEVFYQFRGLLIEDDEKGVLRAVFGVVSKNSSMVTRPSFAPPAAMSRKTFLFALACQNSSKTICLDAILSSASGYNKGPTRTRTSLCF